MNKLNGQVNKMTVQRVREFGGCGSVDGAVYNECKGLKRVRARARVGTTGTTRR